MLNGSETGNVNGNASVGEGESGRKGEGVYRENVLW